jgi:two-component system, OmpR family, sensor histidine kinase ChvG
LITDISELSRIDARLSRTAFEQVDVAALIEGLISLRSARGKSPDVTVSFSKNGKQRLRVSGEASQLSRVIENLIDNAVSFSPPGGTVRIGAGADTDSVIITVDDDGPGISDNAREAIFERFHSNRPEGEAFGKHSGLGLAIARAIINGHNGAIMVAPSEAGRKGARFVIRLPRMAA